MASPLIFDCHLGGIFRNVVEIFPQSRNSIQDCASEVVMILFWNRGKEERRGDVCGFFPRLWSYLSPPSEVTASFFIDDRLFASRRQSISGSFGMRRRRRVSQRDSRHLLWMNHEDGVPDNASVMGFVSGYVSNMIRVYQIGR